MTEPPSAPTFTDTTFEREDVKLDGATFVRCQFGPRCRPHFFGEALPTLHECVIAEPVEFIFSGPAKTTMQFLSMLYHVGGHGGRETVERVVEQLYRGAFEPDRSG